MSPVGKMSTLYFVREKGNDRVMKAVVSENGRVTIPKRIREKLGIVPGTELAFSEDRGRLVAVMVRGGDPFSRWRGKGRLPGARTVDDYLKMVRG